jgi:hypothetical protein
MTRYMELAAPIRNRFSPHKLQLLPQRHINMQANQHRRQVHQPTDRSGNGCGQSSAPQSQPSPFATLRPGRKKFAIYVYRSLILGIDGL